MSLTWWLGIGAGVGVIGLHGALRIWTHRLALATVRRRAFLLLELGGLGVRMALVFAAVALVLLYAPVHDTAFVSTVIALLTVSVAVEAHFVVRRMDRGTLEP